MLKDLCDTPFTAIRTHLNVRQESQNSAYTLSKTKNVFTADDTKGLDMQEQYRVLLFTLPYHFYSSIVNK